MTTKPPVPDRKVRYARILGLLFVLAGFGFIFFGWNGMAKRACVDCQLPYLLSGGAAGLGLIVFGSALLVIASHRAERLAADARFEDLIRATGRMGSALAVTTGDEAHLVVAGRSTYHRPECRLVKDKELDRVTVTVAAESGLTPCRVCSPPAAPSGNAGAEGEATPERKAPAESS